MSCLYLENRQTKKKKSQIKKKKKLGKLVHVSDAGIQTLVTSLLSLSLSLLFIFIGLIVIAFIAAAIFHLKNLFSLFSILRSFSFLPGIVGLCLLLD